MYALIANFSLLSYLIKKKTNLVRNSISIRHLKELCVRIPGTLSFGIEYKLVVTSVCTYGCGKKDNQLSGGDCYNMKDKAEKRGD